MRRSNLKYFLLIAVFCCAICVSVAGCEKHSSSSPEKTPAETPDQEVGNFSLTESLEGTKKWTLWAEWAAIYNEKAKVHARNVRIDFFEEDGTKFSELKADSGIIDQKTNDMEARGNVFVKTEDGITLETQSLSWLNLAQKILSDDFVKITQGRDVLTGFGLVSDPSLNEFEIKKNVQAFVIDKEGKLVPKG
ncbi:MAG: LPS export ABC transporter periplasmic protein LptC [Candidatus Eisenbacteria bacterium]|nr:LPS export ABC transporter periplasmic protein LptC [Candidatus Eisenbacteria bacterium]